MSQMRLLHLHLHKPIEYSYSLLLQEALLKRQFESSDALKRISGQVVARGLRGAEHLPPPPTLVTFQTNPTYTVGRRHLKSNALSSSQINFLTGKDTALRKTNTIGTDEAGLNADLATFHASPRGGLVTYHAPGQLTAYLVYNLRYHGITPRCHIRLLEKAVIGTCREHGVPNTLTTEDPGVWVGNSTDPIADNRSSLVATNRKICAVGVHISRGITSHGLGLNVFDSPIPSARAKHYRLPAPLWNSTSTSHLAMEPKSTDLRAAVTEPPTTTTMWPPATAPLAPGFLSWGFGRVVACGLEGKTVTWLSRERSSGTKTSASAMQDVADTLAREITQGLTTTGRIEIAGVDLISKEEVLGW